MGTTKATSKRKALVTKFKKVFRKPATLRFLFYGLRIVVAIAKFFDSIY